MSRPQVGKLGPFVGGLNNNTSNPSSIADNELWDCLNMEVDLDGGLKMRPSIQEVTFTGSFGSSSLNGGLKAIGSAFLFGSSYVFFQARNLALTYSVYAFNVDLGTWFLVADLECQCVVQVGNLAFFFPLNAGSTGGYWNTSAFATDTNMPANVSAAVYYKQRLWTVAGGSKTTVNVNLRYTEPINPAAPTPLVWTATNSITVGGQDQLLWDLQVYNDNLMLFKEHSTYVFAFDVTPTDGALRLVNDTIGATSRNCVVAFENASYVIHQADVYEIINYNFTKINNKVFFKVGNPVTSDNALIMSIVGSRLVVRYYENLYVFHLRTRTWSRWRSADGTKNTVGKWVAGPTLSNTSGTPTIYYAGTYQTAYNSFFYTIGEMTENAITYRVETGMVCAIATKFFNFGQSASFKKLVSWGAEGVLPPGTMTATVVPASVPYNNLKAMSTWSNSEFTTNIDPSMPNTVTIHSSVTAPAGSPRELYVKIPAQYRFRVAMFVLVINPTAVTNYDYSPRIYNLVATVGIKQTPPPAQVTT